MSPKIAALLPSLQNFIGAVVVSSLGWGLVSIVGLISDTNLNNQRIERLESDYAECRELAKASGDRWHNCRIRFEQAESIIRNHRHGTE